MTPADDTVAARIEEALAGAEDRGEDYAGQLERYADARAEGTELPVTLADARRVIEVLTAMYVSAGEGREVELPFPADHSALRGWRP